MPDINAPNKCGKARVFVSLCVCAHMHYSVKEMDACDTDGLSHLFSISTGNVTDGLAWQVQPSFRRKKKNKKIKPSTHKDRHPHDENSCDCDQLSL